MLVRIFITVLLILTAVTTYTQTHNTIIYSRYEPPLEFSLQKNKAFKKNSTNSQGHRTKHSIHYQQPAESL